ncbi:unnamed protein product [Lactuca saligna]|uniref:Uncharacterized protein n=1 Tax=Lactuca saligna TaxID=75948 RepID=A0AA35V7B8_LACSI|nr:unnamed protein product [Lactuca saligna]
MHHDGGGYLSDQNRLGEGNLDPTDLKVAKEVQKKDFPNDIPECGADVLRLSCEINFYFQELQVTTSIIGLVKIQVRMKLEQKSLKTITEQKIRMFTCQGKHVVKESQISFSGSSRAHQTSGRRRYRATSQMNNFIRSIVP